MVSRTARWHVLRFSETHILALVVIFCCFYIVGRPPSRPGVASGVPARHALHVLPAVENQVVMFAMIARGAERKLPYILRNLERLGAHFKKAYVVLVENNPQDQTVQLFQSWLEHIGWGGEAFSFNITLQPEWRDLRVLAEARNVYLRFLAAPRYSDVDYLVPVDTDMCHPWDVDTMREVLNNLLPSSGIDWDVLFAYGACGWFQSPTSDARQLKPGTHGGFARYCDLFALQDAGGSRYVTKKGQEYRSRVKRGWRMLVAPDNSKEVCSSGDAQAQQCSELHGEPVIPVMSAFGGFGVYRADLFRAPLGTVFNGSACRYSTDGDECEHVTLASCLLGHGVKQYIALRLVVNWQGCKGSVRDTVPDQGPWAVGCPCNGL